MQDRGAELSSCQQAARPPHSEGEGTALHLPLASRPDVLSTMWGAEALRPVFTTQRAVAPANLSPRNKQKCSTATHPQPGTDSMAPCGVTTRTGTGTQEP